MRDRAWSLYLGGMLLLGLSYLFGPAPLHSGPVFNALGASGVIAILVGSRMHRAGPRVAWLLFALGQTLFVCGDIVTYNYERLFGREVPYPSVGDALYLSVYPVLVAGLLVLVHRRNPARDRASLVDSLIIAIAAGVLSWTLLIAPQAHDATLALPTKLISIAYPVMDLSLLAVAVRLAIGLGRRGASFSLLVGGAVVLFLTDSVFGWLLLHGGYEPGGLLDAGWILFYASWGAAALHPSMRALSAPTPDAESLLTRGRLALLAAATIVAPAVQVFGFGLHASVDFTVTALASAALFSLVVARMSGLVRLHEENVRREQALRRAGAALVTATGRDRIYDAALEGARMLVPSASAAALYVPGDGSDELLLAAVTGEPGQGAPGRRLMLDGLPADVRPLLANGEMVDHHTGVLRGAGLVPLALRGVLNGILVVVAEGTHKRRTREALQMLGADVARALDSAALTEDLVRRQSEERFASLFQHSSDVVAVVAAETSIMYASPSVQRVFGYAVDGFEGRRLSDLVHGDDVPRLRAFLGGLAHQTPESSGVIELRIRRHDGTWVHVETVGTNLMSDPRVGGIVLNSRDISERKAFEEQLTRQALYDTLTGLPNRALFRNRLEHALDAQRREEGGVGVLLLDVDDFKTINDSLGHEAGDALLREVAARLQRCVRAADTAARLGGDEFAVLIGAVRSELEVVEVAERIVAALAEACGFRGTEVVLKSSIGIAFGDADGRGAAATDALLRNADVALYMAKEQRQHGYKVFDPAMHAFAVERVGLKADLQRAVRHREFTLRYQPIVDLATGHMSGVEALVRWEHPERGLIGPDQFIPLAEDTGLIVPIGRVILEEACREAVVLQERCPQEPPLRMSVNLSARQLHRPDIADDVRRALEGSGLAPASLVLEITESVMMADSDLAVLRLQELHALGVRLAIDDFGTGYSSLNYVRQFPFDILKVDRSFIADLTGGGEVSALTGAIIELASILKLQPVAEGVETDDQRRRLVELGCRQGQGFFFHRPLTADAVERLASEQATGRLGVSV